MEVNSPKGEIDLVVRTYPNAEVPVQISDIFEFKYIAKTSTDTRLNKELDEALKQAKNYKVGEYEKYRTIGIVFRENKDFEIEIID